MTNSFVPRNLYTHQHHFPCGTQWLQRVRFTNTRKTVTVVGYTSVTEIGRAIGNHILVRDEKGVITHCYAPYIELRELVANACASHAAACA